MPAQSPRVFPDQGAKLRFLIKDRGDRRERSRTNPTLARDAADGGHPRDDRSSIVVHQADLAGFLGVRPSQVSRWCGDNARFPDRLLGELCRLYAVGEDDFRTASYARFVTRYGDAATVSGVSASALSSLWRRLLGAASGHAEILPAWPADETPDDLQRSRLRYATAHRPSADAPLPEVAQGASFWIRLISPQQPNAALIWSGWHLALLNHDVGRDGFRALLPRETNDPTHWATCMPAAGLLTLPRAAILRHEAPDLGPFALVAVLTQDPLPAAILAALGREEAHGLALEPTLDALTAHLAPAMQRGRAGLAVTRYRVVAPRTGDTDA